MPARSRHSFRLFPPIYSESISRRDKVWRSVPVDDVFFVGGGEYGCNLADNSHRVGTDGPFCQAMRQGFTGQKFHHDERCSVGKTVKLEDLDHSRMADRVDRARFI